MKNTIVSRFSIILLTILLFNIVSCNSSSNSDKSAKNITLAEQNILRAMAIVDTTVTHHFTTEGMAMARYYNPYTDTHSDEKGSVWMYTSSIEAINAILHGLKAHKEKGNVELYNKNFERYVQLQKKLYENLAYYEGTFILTSYTQTKEWSVYGVDRVDSKGSARVEGIYNVYDDQQWLIRELLDTYKLTGNQNYLEKAEYLTEYVLDGWDATLDQNGNEYGGITWGPGYASKHACSNGPMVSPLVWLYELYKEKNDEITYRKINADRSRKAVTMKKSEYYLMFAKAIYEWQKKNLLRADGLYDDMMGGCDPHCDITYEKIDGTTYRKHIDLRDRMGPAYSYNSGTMISGAADLYRATNDYMYLEEGQKLSDASFSYFATLGATKPGYYTYSVTGFNNWFNGVLLRGYVDMYASSQNVVDNINSFQQNLDYGYSNYLYNGFLPTDLLLGWSSDINDNKLEAMFSFTFAAEYAVLARYELEKRN